MSKQQPQQQQEEEPGAVVKRTFTADMNPRGSGGGGSSTGKKSRSGSFKSVDASLSPSATHLHKVTTEKMKAAPARISRKDRNHHHHHHHHTAIKAAHAEREVAEQISNAGVGGITEPSSTAMTVATLPESESADSERLLGDHDVTVSRRELVVGAQLEAEEDAQPVAISSPIPSSRYGNPQDPPTLDASESAFAAERFPFDNEDNESDTEEGESPFLTYAQRQAQFGADRLEAKIAYFVQLRTAGSPFFQANPPVSLPIFDIEGEHSAMRCYKTLFFMRVY